MDDLSDVEQSVKHPPASYASITVRRITAAVDSAIPEWRRWSPEMRAVFASLEIADTYTNVGKRLNIDTAGFPEHPGYDGFRKYVEEWYTRRRLPTYPNAGQGRNELTFPDLQVTLCYETAARANALVYLSENPTKQSESQLCPKNSNKATVCRNSTSNLLTATRFPFPPT